LALGIFAVVTAEFLPASLLTPIAADLGVSEGAAGQTVTATAVMGAVTALATAVVTARLDRRVVVWLFTGTLVASNILAAFAADLTMLLISRLLLGLSLGGAWSMAAATAMRLVPQRGLPRAMALITAGVSLATVMSAPLGAYLGGVLGWRAVFLFAAGLGALVLLAQFTTIPRLPPQGRASFRTLFAVLRGPVKLVLLFILVCIPGQLAGFTYVRVFLEQVTGLDVAGISLALLLFGLVSLAGNFLAPLVLERSVALGVSAAAFLITAVSAVFIAAGAVPAVTLVTMAVWGLAFAMLPIGIQTMVVQLAPDRAEQASGLMATTFNIAIATGAIAGGYIVDNLGPSTLFIYTGLSTLLAGLLVFAIPLRKAH
jgi:DHA1 family purine ribonucleoside efflux pump-like MFS transporter